MQIMILVMLAVVRKKDKNSEESEASRLPAVDQVAEAAVVLSSSVELPKGRGESDLESGLRSVDGWEQDAEVCQPDCSVLYRNTLNYINNFFKPDYTKASESEAVSSVCECGAGYLSRQAAFDEVKTEELHFQIALQQGIDPLQNPEGLRRNGVLPSVLFLRNRSAFGEYEYGLVYMLMLTLERASNRFRLEEALEELWLSQKQNIGAKGMLSRWLIQIARKSVEWWGRISGADALQNTRLDVVRAAQGAAAGIAGQQLGAHAFEYDNRSINWAQVELALLAGLLHGSVFRISRIEQWLLHLRRK